MADEITIESREYFSSKRASELSGYAQDYIGQLARSGAIDAHRIGGLWYVSMESLESYKGKPENSSSKEQKARTPEQDTLITFEGRDYISAIRASKLTGYHQDYVGQVARSGKVLSRQIGNRWYVDREALMAHKREKDALLAAVQVESVGLQKNDPRAAALENLSYAGAGPFLTYTSEDNDLIPMLKKQGRDIFDDTGSNREEVHQVPIRIREEIARPERYQRAQVERPARSRAPGKTIFYGSFAAAALTIVIVLTFGFPSIREGSVYAFHSAHETALAGLSVSGISELLARLGDILEHWIVPEIVYKRSF